MKTASQQSIKQRKFLLVLPLLILPFVIILFVVLGGGKAGGSSPAATADRQGLNLKLPAAHFKKTKERGKLDSYEQAWKDSIKIKEAIRNDPYYKRESSSDLDAILEKNALRFNQPQMLKTSPTSKVNADSNETKMLEKLARLRNEINKQNSPETTFSRKKIPQQNNPDVERMEKMMGNIKKENSSDPEMDKIDGMLDKIMAIQHPESIANKSETPAIQDKQAALAVHVKIKDDPISVFPTSSENVKENGFFGIDAVEAAIDAKRNTIEAVVNETQTLVPGDPIRLRLLNDVFIEGMKIPKNHLLTGTTSLNNDRLTVSVNAIAYQGNIFPVKMDVYDNQGMAGIYIPGSMNRDAAKQSADQSISSIGLTSLDPSIGAQAASAGIQAAKTLIGKKIKLVKITVKAGYPLLLKDTHSK